MENYYSAVPPHSLRGSPAVQLPTHWRAAKRKVYALPGLQHNFPSRCIIIGGLTLINVEPHPEHICLTSILSEQNIYLKCFSRHIAATINQPLHPNTVNDNIRIPHQSVVPINDVELQTYIMERNIWVRHDRDRLSSVSVFVQKLLHIHQDQERLKTPWCEKSW